MKSERPTRTLFVLCLLSGSCALAYEVLYMRLLTSLMGDMFYVHAALLSTFLLGIGIGALIAHRVFRKLAHLEILTGLYAMSIPFFAELLVDLPLINTISQSSNLTIFVTALLLLIPSLCIGASIPLFSAYIKEQTPDRLSFRRVYQVYNLGALSSILIVEFFLVRAIGLQASFFVLGGINVFNGIVLLFKSLTPDHPLNQARHRFSKNIFLALFLASTASAIFQMFFLNLCSHILYPHRENFAIGLFVILLGIFLGSWIVPKLKIRFETCIVGMSLSLGLIFSTFSFTTELHHAIFKSLPDVMWVDVGEKLLTSSFFGLIPMFFFGGLLPAILSREGKVEEEAGSLLFVSGLANAFGYLLYVLFLHELLPNPILLYGVGILGILAFVVGLGKSKLKPKHAVALVLSLLSLLLMHQQWNDNFFYVSARAHRIERDIPVRTFKGGPNSATLVDAPRSSYVTFNGHISINVHEKGKINTPEVLVGIIPALFSPSQKKAAVIGLGTGITAGTVSRIFNQTDVIEINEAFLQMLPVLSYANFNLNKNPNAKLHYGDGRSYITGKQDYYDAIINTPPPPSYYSASKLYSVDYYKKIVKALKPEGVFGTWISLSEMSSKGMEVILNGLHRHFSTCALHFLSSAYYMLTCGNHSLEEKPFHELSIDPMVVKTLEKAFPGLVLDEVFSDIKLIDNIFDRFTPVEHDIHSDNYPILEFMRTKFLYKKFQDADIFLSPRYDFQIDPLRQHETYGQDRKRRMAKVYRILDRNYFKKFFAKKFPELTPVSPFKNILKH